MESDPKQGRLSRGTSRKTRCCAGGPFPSRFYLPGKPVAYNYGLPWLIYGLLWVIV